MDSDPKSFLKYESMLEEYPDTVLVFGEGASEQLAAFLSAEKADSLQLFCGSTRGGAAKTLPLIQNILADMGMDVSLYMDIPAEPSADDVRRMTEVLKKEQPQFVAALGGGSVMDAAKAAYLSWQSGLDVSELFGVNQASVKCPGKEFKRILCLPTTSGTGSEATPYSNIVDPASGVKKLIMEEQIIPRCAFIDPGFAATMPQELTLVTALDALVHSIESFLNRNAPAAHPHSLEWGRESVRLIASALPGVLRNPANRTGRAYLAAAAALGGMCIRNRPTSLPHLASFSLYGKVPHGLAVALLLIPFWRYYLEDKAVRESTMGLSGIFSPVPEKTPEAVVDACERFMIACGRPARLSDVKTLDRSVISKIASDAALNPMKLQSCPRPMTPENAPAIIAGILEKAW